LGGGAAVGWGGWLWRLVAAVGWCGWLRRLVAAVGWCGGWLGRLVGAGVRVRGCAWCVGVRVRGCAWCVRVPVGRCLWSLLRLRGSNQFLPVRT